MNSFQDVSCEFEWSVFVYFFNSQMLRLMSLLIRRNQSSVAMVYAVINWMDMFSCMVYYMVLGIFVLRILLAAFHVALRLNGEKFLTLPHMVLVWLLVSMS